MSSKKAAGQFYTVQSAYILDGVERPHDVRVIEPFAGQWHSYRVCPSSAVSLTRL
jgi:hypothetical protein